MEPMAQPADKKDLSPFGVAALELDADFVELERLSGQLERLSIESESGLERAQRLLVKFGECGQRIGEGVTRFSKALEEAHARAEKAAQAVAVRAVAVKERRQESDELLERFRVLGTMVGEITAFLARYRKPPGNALSAEERHSIARQIPEIDARLGTLIDEAAKLKTDAQRSRMRGLERDADSLGQTLLSARRKLTEFIKNPALN
jgi:hypothetical protein